MRRTNTTIGAKLPYPINPSSSQTLVPFSTSSFGRGCDGRGRGRGRGGCPPRFDFSAPLRAPGQSPHAQNDSDEPPPPPPPKSQGPSLLGHGHGRGRGNPLPPPSPILPSFSGFVPSAAGRGRGGLGASSFDPVPPRAPPPSQQQQQQQEELRESEEAPPIAAEDSGNIAESIASLLPGAGRGRPQKEPEIQSAQQLNRHIRPRKTDAAWVPAAAKEMVAAAPKEAVATERKMSEEEACKHAMEVLARNSEAGRGRGRGRGVRGRGTGRGRGRFVEEEDEKETGLYLGDDADGERFAQKVGPEIMSLLTEGFEEVGDRVLPPAVEQMHLEALDMNFKLEFEPEFLMGDIESNPNIDEKPPIPLRDALEKAKPFVMAYENIQSQEEWEEVMKETMDRVPLLKEIVDHYSGLGRVTAKKQHQELDRVAKTLPTSAPNSVKQFTERAVLSLQNNPGWGFHRKCQFMDKLVWRTSQHYK